jgi:hypothetical protein
MFQVKWSLSFFIVVGLHIGCREKVQNETPEYRRAIPTAHGQLVFSCGCSSKTGNFTVFLCLPARCSPEKVCERAGKEDESHCSPKGIPETPDAVMLDVCRETVNLNCDGAADSLDSGTDSRP